MTWLDLPDNTPFGITNLPYGIYSTSGNSPRTGVAIGDQVLDVTTVTGDHVHRTGTLNAFLSRGRTEWRAVRTRLQDWLTEAANRDRGALLPLSQVRLHLPLDIGDYVDFYSSRDHAENMGELIRPGTAPLAANWLHLPIGYHGRSGTVQVSGTPVVRPCGQRKTPQDELPSFGPSRRLDIEAEVGFVVGTPSQLGRPVPVADFAEHVFGVCLVNDWSARDLQAWEYVPLGPFLGKSFLTSVSPWLVPLDALQSARVRPPDRELEVHDYLADDDHPWGLALDLEVRLNGHLVSRPPFAGMYWTAAQQLAHLTSNGASVRTGDLYASGTVSGPARDQVGSFLELTWNGTEPVKLADGTTRGFLLDGDRVTISATAPGATGVEIGLGEVTGTIFSA
jgi:fumarylacetoacetase